MPAISPKYLGVSPARPFLGLRPLYPINTFYRWLPAVGLFAVASVYHTIMV